MSGKKYSCVMVEIDGPSRKLLQSYAASIPLGDLADDGAEFDSHVTVKQGLLTEDPREVLTVLPQPGQQVTARIVGLDAFEGESYDALYAKIESPQLEELNAIISESLEHEDRHDTYVPHATIAYVKPGLALKYLAKFPPIDEEFVANSLIFSRPDARKFYISLFTPQIITKSIHGLLTRVQGAAKYLRFRNLD